MERNVNSLSEKIQYLIKNYQEIMDEMKTNQLPSKRDFINQMKNILYK